MNKLKSAFEKVLLLLVFILLVKISCQLYIQFSGKNGLIKTPGSVVKVAVKEPSESGNYRDLGKPFYAVFINLDNKKNYTISLNNCNLGIA